MNPKGIHYFKIHPPKLWKKIIFSYNPSFFDLEKSRINPQKKIYHPNSTPFLESISTDFPGIHFDGLDLFQT